MPVTATCTRCYWCRRATMPTRVRGTAGRRDRLRWNRHRRAWRRAAEEGRVAPRTRPRVGRPAAGDQKRPRPGQLVQPGKDLLTVRRVVLPERAGFGARNAGPRRLVD